MWLHVDKAHTRAHTCTHHFLKPCGQPGVVVEILEKARPVLVNPQEPWHGKVLGKTRKLLSHNDADDVRVLTAANSRQLRANQGVMYHHHPPENTTKSPRHIPLRAAHALHCAELSGHRVVGSMKVFTLVVALAAVVCSATGADVGATSQHNGLGPFSRLYRPRSMPSPCTTVQGSCGESLHLSRLPPAVARKASRVEGIGSFPSYAGFFTVREDTDNNLFFWYAMCSAMCNVQVCRCRCRCRCSCSPSEAAASGTL